MKRIVLILPTLLSFVIVVQGTVAAEPDREGLDFFERKIRPILVARCYHCHSADAANAKELKGGLQLDTRDGIRTGGESGPAVVPGKPGESELISAIQHESVEMPPKGQLPVAVIDDFVKWVEMGAPDPRDGTVVVQKEEIDLEAARKFWSFQRPKRNEPPPVKNTDWPRDAIDRFVLAEQEERGLNPVGAADATTLIRRLYYDLIGLPPSPAEIETFELAFSRDGQSAIERLVDSLLDSRHFGERWGRHWLDVARFSESNGAPDKNGTWPIAYRYRDYVIDSFDSDKPFNRFVLEQVAGDLLAVEDEQKHADLIVATGLLALGMKTPGKRMDEIDEQIDVLGKAVLGMAIGCARCHDHKFDPIPTRDYYAMAGMFINSVPQDGNSTFTRARYIGDIDKSRVNEIKNYLQSVGSKEGEARKLRREIREIIVRETERYDVALSLEGNIARIESGQRKKADERLQKLKNAEAEAERLRDDLESIHAFAVALKETGVKGKMANTRIHIRGTEGNLGDEVPRGLLSVFPEAAAVHVPDDASGRLELAEWLASNGNPLTARVFVNRVWHHLLGRGIVQTTDNFGTVGERPTHRELLDTLAVDFMDDGWSVKRLIRRIVLTRTYQLNDQFNAANYETDPENIYLWRWRTKRLDAEAIRDYMLAASGRLDREPMRGSLIKTFGSFRGSFNIDQETKRSIYMPALRGGTPDLLAVFNFPPPSLVIGNRQSTTVPTQALAMLNSPWVIEQADYMALRLLKEANSDDERVELMYRLILGRQPSDDEQALTLTFAKEIRSDRGAEEYAERDAWSLVCQSLFGSAEFLWIR